MVRKSGRLLVANQRKGTLSMRDCAILRLGGTPNAVRVEQDFKYHGRMKGRTALAAITKSPEYRFEIKRTGHIGDEACQMLLQEPVIQVGSKQKHLIGIGVTEVVPHDAGRLVYLSEFIGDLSKYWPTDKRSVGHQWGMVFTRRKTLAPTPWPGLSLGMSVIKPYSLQGTPFWRRQVLAPTRQQ